MSRPPLRLLLSRLTEWRHLGGRLLLLGWGLRSAWRRSDVQPWRARATPGAAALLHDWIARFDTPAAQVLAQLTGGAFGLPRAQLLVCCAPAEVQRPGQLRERLSGVCGLQAEVLLHAPGATLQQLDALAAAIGSATLVPSTDRALRQDLPVIVVARQAWPRGHGPRLLLDALEAAPDAALAYADEVMSDADGSPRELWCKPRWCPDLAQQGLLPGGLWALRRLAVEPGADPLQAAWRAVHGLAAPAVVHLAHLASTWRGPPAPAIPWVAPCLQGAPEPLVSVLIPTRNRWDLLSRCLESIAHSDWPRHRLEVIVIDNGSDQQTTLQGLQAAEAAGALRVLRDPGAFNYARLNNRAAQAARGDVLILLNNDTEVRDRDWIRALAAAALQPGVGAVGARLLYPDGKVQHAGLVLGLRGLAMHVHVGLGPGEAGYHGMALLSHTVSALTGACLAVQRRHYLAAGGMDEALPVTFNDVAFCLELMERGLRNLYLARALLVHHESRSRGLALSVEQRAEARAAARRVWSRYRHWMADDPCYSPCLSLERAYAPAFAPRRRPAWLRWLGDGPCVLVLAGSGAVAARQAPLVEPQLQALVQAGFAVVLAAQRRPSTPIPKDVRCLQLRDGRAAMAAALALHVDAIVVHAAPFQEVASHCGNMVPVLAFDHGAAADSAGAPPVLAALLAQQRLQWLAMCTRVYPAAPDAACAAGPALLAALAECGVAVPDPSLSPGRRDAGGGTSASAC